MTNDTIARLLPYCDVMFIDKECYALLKEVPLNKLENEFNTKLFSLGNKQAFMEYLDEIEKNASKKHKEKVSEVYGLFWK